MSDPEYRDRREAGRLLADAVGAELAALTGDAADPIVLGLPRGGVPVAVEVAHALGLSWDVLVVRKVGAPNQPELAVGAVGEGGIVVRNSATAGMFTESDVAVIEAREQATVTTKVDQFRGGQAMVELSGRIVVIVDDGLATGTTMAAAVSVARAAGARWIIAAAPVGSAQAVAWLRHSADAVVCPSIPPAFVSVGQHYRAFDQVSDDEVIASLRSR